MGQADINAIFYQKKDDVVSPKRHILQVSFSLLVAPLFLRMIFLYMIASKVETRTTIFQRGGAKIDLFYDICNIPFDFVASKSNYLII